MMKKGRNCFEMGGVTHNEKMAWIFFKQKLLNILHDLFRHR